MKSLTEVSVTASQCACTFEQLIVCTVLCPPKIRWWSPIVLSTGNCCPPVYEMCDHTPEGSVHLAGTHSNRCCIHLHWPERKQSAQSDYYPPMIKLSKCVSLCNWYQQVHLKIYDHSIFVTCTETTQEPPQNLHAD